VTGSQDSGDGTATFAELLLRRAEDDSLGLRYEDRSRTWREVVEESRRRGSVTAARRVPGAPWHVGVLLENTPEHLFWMLGATTAGATVVGVNPTRRGADLARDIRFTDCGLVVTDDRGRALLDGLELGLGQDRVLDVGGAEYHHLLAAVSQESGPVAGPDTTFSLAFTSGTTSAPKAVVCTQRLRRMSGSEVGAEISVVKVYAALAMRWGSRELTALLGPLGALWDTSPRYVEDDLGLPAILFGGGTVEIQLNVIAQRVLGLPRRTASDR
jgi:acyl-CoA synthetase (AMP-forming)/AMP-acid ligase II